jgi:hypothetical protein
MHLNLKGNGYMAIWESMHVDMPLTIDGVGIVLYSDGAVRDIPEGEDYLSKEYSQPSQVAEHIHKGDVVGFCTGSPGDYVLRFRSGYPDPEQDEQYPISARLAIAVDGGRLSAIDLYWLMEWSSDFPSEQQLEIEDGIYHITLLTRAPDSGIHGDNQEIYVFLNRLEAMPDLAWEGVPQLF